MAFSVQFAAEPTSVAAPLTVLHAAIARHAPTNATATSFWIIIIPPLDVRNDNESPNSCLSTEPYLQPLPFIVFSVQFATELTSRAAPRTVLQAATLSAIPSRTTVVTFWSILVSPFRRGFLTPGRRNGSITLVLFSSKPSVE